MAKLNRLIDYINVVSLPIDIINAEKVLKKTIVGEQRGKTAVLEGIKQNVLKNAYAVFEEALLEKVEEHKMFNGERPAEEYEDWDAGIDEACEDATTNHVEVLSQNWLGTETIDTQLHEEGAVARIAKSFASEVYKQITDKATGDEIIAASGVDMAEFDRVLASKEIIAESAEAEAQAFSIAISRIAENNKGNYDPLVMYDFLDNATDNDDGLSLGATTSLMKASPSEDVIAYARALQNFRKANGKDAVQKLFERIVAEMDAPAVFEAGELSEEIKGKIDVVEIPAPVKTMSKGKRVAKNQKLIDAVVNQEKIIPPGVLKDLQAALGNDDTTMAAIIGTSRQSWSNYATGKREFTATDAQMKALYDALWIRRDKAENMMRRMNEGHV